MEENYKIMHIHKDRKVHIFKMELNKLYIKNVFLILQRRLFRLKKFYLLNKV